MTIREVIEAKIAKARAWGIGAWVLMALSALFLRDSQAASLALLPTAVFFGSGIYALFLIRCPRCYERINQALRWRMLEACPNCGVQFNEKA